MCLQELINYRKDSCVKLFGKLFRDSSGLRTNFPESFIEECNAKIFATDAFYPTNSLENRHFVAEIDSRAISCMTNVGLASMQFALYMNPDKIYIVGCDHSGGHFTNGNQSKIETVAESLMLNDNWRLYLNGMRKQWIDLRTFAKVYYPNTEIVSVNPVGLKGIFTDWYQDTGEVVRNEVEDLPMLYSKYYEQVDKKFDAVFGKEKQIKKFIKQCGRCYENL